MNDRELAGALAALPGDDWCCGACGTTRKWLERERVKELVTLCVQSTMIHVEPLFTNKGFYSRIVGKLAEDITETVMRYSPAREHRNGAKE